VNKVDLLFTLVWIWNIETCQSHIQKGEGKRDNNEGDEPNWGALYTYMKMSQWNPLYNYYTLIKILKLKKSELWEPFQISLFLGLWCKNSVLWSDFGVLLASFYILNFYFDLVTCLSNEIHGLKINSFIATIYQAHAFYALSHLIFTAVLMK
jgi:hypothetical protein